MRNIQKVLKFAQEKMGRESTGHDWFHVERVFKTATEIAKAEKGADLFIVQASALLHDIGDWKVNNSNLSEEQIVSKACDYLKLDSDDKKEILKLIPNISYSRSLGLKNKLSLEGKIVQDADRLEALGAIGIARAFAFGGKKNRLIYDPNVRPQEFTTTEEYRNTNSPTINHFYEKLFKIRKMLNTKVAKKIAARREKFMKDFLKEFYSEWNGKS